MADFNSAIDFKVDNKDRLLGFILGSPENRNMLFKKYDDSEKRQQNEEELLEMNSVMESCRPLYEYAWLVSKVKDNTKRFTMEPAVELAIEFMPEDFLIKPFMKKNMKIVLGMMLKEYDDARSMELSRNEGKKEGIREGRLMGISEGRESGFREGLCEGVRKAASMLRCMKFSDEQIVEKICYEFGLGRSEVLELV
ncbi:hypothetical protein [Butyrivibrio sp. WCD3002]|uniref:hypothetical protein n=1 Tax=Butyrivibrio sp. WCD3002 TaxID=1280676 RepID=UPI0003FBFBEF|nr:hypothetical protein [Butyrivibrio sp. WCD3002]